MNDRHHDAIEATHPADPRAGAANRPRARRSGRARVTQHAQARSGTRRRGDGGVLPLREQGAGPRWHRGSRLRRDRAAPGRRRLEDGHAPAGDLGPGCPVAPSVGDRAHGVADQPGPGEPSPPRRRYRVPSGGRLRHGGDRDRVLAPGQLHLWIRLDEDEPAVRRHERHRRDVGDHARALRAR